MSPIFLASICALIDKFGIGKLVEPLKDCPDVQVRSRKGRENLNAHLDLRLRCGNGNEYEKYFPGEGRELWLSERSLWYLLNKTRSCHASDPRDKIFALFGLADDLEGCSPTVDYSKPLGDIEMEVTKFLINQGRGLQVLRKIWLFSAEDVTTPSWIYRVNHPLGRSNRFHCAPRPKFQALRSYGTELVNAFRCTEGSQKLFIKGWMLDAIGEMEAVKPGGSGCLCVPDLEKMISSSQLIDHHRLPTDALWRTLIGNRTMVETPAPAEFATHWDAYRNTPDIMARDGESKFVLCIPYTQQRVHVSGQDGTKLFISKSGQIGIVPISAKEGDSIFTIAGDTDGLTFIIRPRGPKDHYTWVGQAYVHCVTGEEYREIEEVEPMEIVID